jgi:hypothetical protein
VADFDAKRYVVNKLVEHHAAVFEPIGDAGVDLAVRTGDGQFVEIIIRESSSPDRDRSFVMKRFRPRQHVFIVGVAAGPQAWLIPGHVFERFASGAPGEPEWDLDLDDSAGEPLSQRLGVYKERWALIAEYSKFRSTLGDPMALQVRIAMG